MRRAEPKTRSSSSASPSSRKSATKRDVAQGYNVSLRTVDNWVRERKIPYRKLGGRLVRFDLDAVERALSRYTVKEIR